jgi:uncharacterized protein (TIGR03083 family)
MSLMAQARAEREELLDLLEGLAPEQWQTPSLCAGWTVHDVVAHVLSYEDLGPRQLAARFADGRLLVSRINAIGVRESAARTPADMVEQLRSHLTPRGFTAGLGGAIALTDGLIHQQDIRRPLDRPRTIPADRLVPALRVALFGPVLRGWLRVRDVRLVATDIDWSSGRGPEVRGTGEALLLAVAGRPAVSGELSGPGSERVVRRLG